MWPDPATLRPRRTRLARTMEVIRDPTPGRAVSAVEIRLLDLPLVEPFAASHGTTTSRTLVVVRIESGDHHGWGECSALPAATYTPESAVGSHRFLVEAVAPALVTGGVVDLTAHPMVRSSIRMARLDLELRVDGRSLAQHLGATTDRVPAGVSLGLDRPDAVVARARSLVDEGYRRLKVKIQPGHDREVLDGLRADPTIAATGPEIHLDANGAYGADHLDLVAGLALGSGGRRGADALEQPFAPADVATAVALVDRLAERADRPVPVVADEAVTTLDDARTLADRGAITGVSIKPARVGGLDRAVGLHDLCRQRGLAATAGGMLECGLGRHALAALAALPGFGLTGDLSPAGRWLAADPWPDLALTDGHILVPPGPGVAPDPDPELLERHTVAVDRIEAPR